MYVCIFSYRPRFDNDNGGLAFTSALLSGAAFKFKEEGNMLCLTVPQPPPNTSIDFCISGCIVKRLLTQMLVLFHLRSPSASVLPRTLKIGIGFSAA